MSEWLAKTIGSGPMTALICAATCAGVGLFFFLWGAAIAWVIPGGWEAWRVGALAGFLAGGVLAVGLTLVALDEEG